MYAMQIQTGELRETDLPAGYGEWSDYAKFAVTFAPRDRDLCSEAASDAFARWRRTGDVPRTLEELRACLWYEQRRWRFLGREPDTEGMRYAGPLIGAMPSNDPPLAAFRVQLENVAPLPRVAEYEQIATQIAQDGEAVVRGRMTIEQALNDLDAKANRILAKRRWVLARR